MGKDRLTISLMVIKIVDKGRLIVEGKKGVRLISLRVINTLGVL